MNQILSNALAVMLVLTAVFTATVVSKQDATDSDPVSPVVVNETVVEFMSSHQFDNVNPMGYGECIEQEVSNDTTLNITLFSRFHEPVAWEQGMVNVTITYGNETVWSYQTSETNQTDFTLDLNRSGTYVFEILSEGSDDPTTSDPGDAYVAEFEASIRTVVA